MITLDLSKVPGLFPMIALVPKGKEERAFDALMILNRKITALFERDANNEYHQAILN